MSSLQSFPSPIIITGAGPAGLTLANILQKHSIPCVVYEAEAGPHARNQGGTLDLHEDTGLKALKAAGLLEVVMRKARTGDAESMKIMRGNGEVVYDENASREDRGAGDGGDGIEVSKGKKEAKELAKEEEGDTRGRPEIDRTDLRQTLIDSLLPDTIMWNHKITEFTATTKDTYEIHFASQPPITTHVLIGADGTWSKVRRLLHSVDPHYTGLTMFDLQISAESLTDELRAFIGNGTCMILDSGKGLIPQMNAGGKCRAYAAVFDANKPAGDMLMPEQGGKSWLKSLYEGWDERCGELVDKADEETIVERKIWAVDPDLTWDSDLTGVTIIGDAAHLMAPSGEGVNLALHDALVLSESLIKLHTVDPSFSDRTAVHQTLRAFEQGMMERAKEEIETSEMMLQTCYGPEGGADAFNGMLQEMMAGGPPQE